MTPDPRGPPGDLVGRTLGDFVVRAALGEGGHGVVYRAEQPALGREAVIKVIQTKLQASGELVQRFLREARLASKLDHPYAAHVYAFGAEPDGLLWIAMELVRGTPLDRVLAAQGPMPLERFVPFFERLCEVVHTAHEQGIVHRDLKPANVMVIARAGRVLPKLLDLGIAKATDVARTAREGDDEVLTTSGEFPAGEVSAETTPTKGGTGITPTGAGDLGLTQRGEIVGSPRYMAPEQWVNLAVDARADIYSLGVLAYELLTGRRPFAGSTMKALAKAHARNAVPPLGDGFPGALHDALSRGMAKKAADRFSTAIELAASVRAASGLEAEREALPRLDEETRAAALTEAPQPIADAVAALDQARNGHQLREALWEVVAVLCHLLGVLALGCRSRLAERPTSELLLALTRRSLADGEWLELARELCRPFAQEREAFPMPELATFVLDGRGELEAMATAERTGSFSEEQLRPILVKQMAALGRVLRAVGFLSDYRLVTAREDGTVDLWAGPRRAGPRALALTGGSRMTAGSVAVVDAATQPVLLLSPLAQLHPPTPGSPDELFFFAGKGRRGARFVAPPRGFEHIDESFWGWFRDHLFAAPGESAEAVAAEVKPYRGLASFTRDDASLFFGREAESDAFRNRLRLTPLLAVVGPSGAGKSSFVEAGVVPNLPADTHALRVRPGAAPLAALTARLDAEGAPEAATPGDRLRALARTRGGTVLLIVDQAEELFTLCLDDDERRAYARALVESARSVEEPVRVVLTLRDDFLVRATELGAFRDRIAQGLQILTTPAREDLLRIVTLPAERAGYRFEDADLPARMVDSVAGRPGALALLSFTAARLWELRDRHFKQLPRKAYDAIGGVAGALAQHAEATRESLPPDEQRLLRDAFRALVTAEGTRAVLRRSELLEVLGDTPAAARVIDRLVDARLLVTAESETGATVEVIHEALLSAWPRLVEWRREDAEGARLRDQLRAAARQWDERTRAPGLLWRGDALAEYERWRARYPGQLTAVESAFGDASTAESRRSRRNRRILVGAIFAGLSAALAVALVLRAQATRAQASAETARARTQEDFVALLRDQGRRLLLDDNVLQAYPYLAEAYERQGPSVGLLYMLGRARRILEQQIAVLPHQGIVWDVVFSPDGQTLFSCGDDKVVKLWDRTGKSVGTLGVHEDEVTAVAVTPDGRTLASGGANGRLLLWDLATRTVRADLRGHTGLIVGLSFSSDGARLGSASADGTARVWSLADSTTPAVIAKHPGGVRALRFLRGDTDVVTGGMDGEVRRWRAADGTLVSLLWSKSGAIRSMQASRDRAFIGWGAASGTLGVFDVASGETSTVGGHGGELLYAAIAPDGAMVLSSSVDGTTLLWSRRPALKVASLTGHGSGVFHASFSDDGRWIATGGYDASAILWDAATHFPEARLAGHTATVRRVVFDPAGELLATGSVDGTARLWRPRSPDLRKEWPAHAAAVTGIAVSPRGDLVATTADDGWLRVWRTDSWKLATERELGEGLTDVAWAPRGDALIALRDKRVALLDWPGLRESAAYEHDETLTRGCVEPDGTIALADGAGGLTQWTPSGQTPPARWKAHSIEVTSLTCSSRGVLSTGADFRLAIWDRPGVARTQIQAEAEVITASWNPRVADELLIAASDTTARIWSVSEGRTLRVLSGHTGPVTDAGYAPEGLVVTSSRDGSVRIWDPSNGAAVGALRHGGRVPVRVASGHFGVISAAWDGSLTWWDMTPEEESANAVKRIASCRVPYRLQGESLVFSKLDCSQTDVEATR